MYRGENINSIITLNALAHLFGHKTVILVIIVSKGPCRFAQKVELNNIECI